MTFSQKNIEYVHGGGLAHEGYYCRKTKLGKNDSYCD